MFAGDKRKAVLIRGLETPFLNAENSAIWYAFESETRFSRDDKRKVVLKRLYLRPTCPTNCVMQLRSDSRLVLAIEFDINKRNNSRKAFAYAFW